ncbi:hypothetical protein [Chlamydia sp. 17-3921]|uniref:hypothetical protein n=1 Tax=Chlamydia sp. 17-3921 TaxID=2675798 RepID=UPI001917AD82|nr:hypothetical protein [Chlamydia sp. 17-3921]
MARKFNHILTLLPGIVWVVVGTKLLLKAVSDIFISPFSFVTSLLLSMLAWGLSSIKYKCILQKIAETQHVFAEQFISKKISTQKYLKNSFFSKGFIVLIAMLLLSMVLRKFISHSAIIFVIRATIGYALIKTATTYFSLIQKTLPQA